ncbi:glycosyltransferase family 1 protein [Bosea sp. ASV33]|uniref:glycosyltransferase family 4 protein n=1 Tax=Bosea sp. ASV33 TaxID=2795106 RepID=UPI0018EB9576|nr:glycosyltransferase family 1 protein [Bosea sp. ASV33]
MTSGLRRREIYINGRFLSQAVTGVQRYAAELVKALDRLVAEGSVPPGLAEATFTLLLPPNAERELRLTAIGQRRLGRLRGHAWDQVELAHASRQGVLVSLANSGPVLHRRHLIVLHDAQVYRHPEFFSRSYLALHRTLGRLYARTAHLGTVSAFSRKELAAALKLSQERFSVIPNSAEHIAATVPDHSILARLGIEPRRFFLAVGSMNRNKNITTAIEAARLLGRADHPLVVVGGGNHQVFGGSDGGTGATGAIFAGRLSDEEVAALYCHATAFVFPSLYEGFGLPPLEAMTFGCPVLASTAEAVVEVCGDAVRYFEPHDAERLSTLMRERIEGIPSLDLLAAAQGERLKLYSWQRSAQTMLEKLALLANS